MIDDFKLVKHKFKYSNKDWIHKTALVFKFLRVSFNMTETARAEIFI